MSLDTGTVVWHEAPFKTPRPDGSQPDRPWLVVSNDNHPFQGTEYVVLGMTTNPRAQGVQVHGSDWIDGGTTKPSFVSPWFVMTLKHADIGYRIGALEASIARSTIDDLSSRLG